jgi:predicted transcriptional regulator
MERPSLGEDVIVGPKRSKMEILIDILPAIARGNNKPTNIMYRSNLSWKRVSISLDILVNQGMLNKSISEDHANHNLTERGYAALMLYADFVSQFQESSREDVEW